VIERLHALVLERIHHRYSWRMLHEWHVLFFGEIQLLQIAFAVGSARIGRGAGVMEKPPL
jgi:hypothetical protein